MTFSINEGQSERNINMGSVAAAILELDVTSYNGSGSPTGEDVSPSSLDVSGDILFLDPVVDEKNLNAKWDKSAERLRLFYPSTSHSHTAFQSDGTDDTPGAHQGLQDGAGSGTGLQIGVDTSAQAGESVSTSTASAAAGDELANGDDGGLVQCLVIYRG